MPRRTRTVEMRTFTVYRFDYVRQVREPVGQLMERRKEERGKNINDLLRLAQRVYSESSLDSHIVITPD
jgi:hypothetical protein